MADKIIYRNSKKPANIYSFAGFLNKAADWFEGDSSDNSDNKTQKTNILGLTLGGTNLANTGLLIGLGIMEGVLNPNGVSTGVGNALLGIGSVASAIPGVGGLIGTGVSMVGGLVNSAFGSKLNDSFIDSTRAQINKLAGYNSVASDPTSLMSDYNSYLDLSNVSKKLVGSDGWFSNRASRKTKLLNNEIAAANLRARSSLINAGDNIAEQSRLNALANYSSFGGPLNFYRDNASYPHIYSSFKLGGYLTDNILFRNRPYFKDGGVIEGDFDLGDLDITEEEIDALKNLGYDVTID